MDGSGLQLKPVQNNVRTLNRALILLILTSVKTKSPNQVASRPIKSNTCEDGSPDPSEC
jgi:hypothetical protein